MTSSLPSTPRRPPRVAWALAASLVVYTVIALAIRHWWISGAAAPVIAVLLWRAHPRARFSAYVFFSVVALRGGLRNSWGSVVYAVAAILLLQTPAALRAWPRLRPGRRPGGAPRAPDDRMAAP
jgi:hypothetical protein